MTRPTHSDLRSALEFVRRLECTTGLGSFRRELLTGLRELIPCELATYDEMDLTTGTAVVDEDPQGSVAPEQLEAFQRHMDQHPLLAHVARTGERAPLRLSDFVSRRELRRLDLYDGVFRPLGLDHQIAVVLPVPPLAIGVSLKRGRRDFTERERNLLALIRPHVSAARRNAELRHLHLASEELPESPERAPGIALLSEAGPILAANRFARRLLTAYFDGAARPRYLPNDLARWVRAQRGHRAGDRPRPPSPELRVRAVGGTLSVRFLPRLEPADPDVLLLSESVPQFRVAALEAAGLSAREVEVLALAGKGLRNAAIAQTLSVSPATIKKHLENCYRKLGASGRMAAVTRAREISHGR